MAIPKPGGGGGEGVEGMLKWLFGFLIVLFFVWLVTGGPERYRKLKPGPFEPTPPPPASIG